MRHSVQCMFDSAHECGKYRLTDDTITTARLFTLLAYNATPSSMLLPPQAWNPYYAKDTCLLEKVLHCFTRLFPELRSLPYEQCLKKPNLWSHEKRGNRTDLIEMYKMVKWFSAVPWSFFFQWAYSITRGNEWKFCKQHSQCNVCLHSYSQHTIFCWNHLSQEETDAPSVNSFKNHQQTTPI